MSVWDRLVPGLLLRMAAAVMAWLILYTLGALS